MSNYPPYPSYPPPPPSNYQPPPPGPSYGQYPPSQAYPPQPPPQSYPPPQGQYPPSNYPPPGPLPPHPGNYEHPPPAQGGGYAPPGGYGYDDRGPPGYDRGPPNYDRPPDEHRPNDHRPNERRRERGGRNRDHGPRERRGGRGKSPDGRGRKLNDRDHPTIEERVGRERPCRTLFIRNVSYEANTERIREDFAAYGDVKTYFDLVSKRGMIFITYFDLRAAERARDAMHNTEVMGRPIDVHYSLPRPDEMVGRPDRDKNQGSMMVTVRHERVLNEHELRRTAEKYGDIKVVKPCRQADQKIVEFYDSRGAALFFDEMNDRPFGRGSLKIDFVYDELDPWGPAPPASERPAERPPPRERERDRGPRRSGEGPGYGEVKGYHPPPRQEPPRPEPPRRDPRLEDRYNQGRYAEAPPPPAPQGDDRLEKARQVQQLLASLGSAPSAPPAAPPAQPQYSPPFPQSQPYPPAQAPSYPAYSPPPGGSSIPPDVLALLQQQPNRPPPSQGYQPPQGQYQGGAKDVNSLLAMLSNHR